jgi:hypothetical protein
MNPQSRFEISVGPISLSEAIDPKETMFSRKIYQDFINSYPQEKGKQVFSDILLPQEGIQKIMEVALLKRFPRGQRPPAERFYL